MNDDAFVDVGEKFQWENASSQLLPRKNVEDDYTDGYDSYWTGKQLYSMILPNINMQKILVAHRMGRNHRPSVTDSYVYIENGTLHCGNIDKKSLGAGTNALIHITWLGLDQWQHVI